MILIIGQNPSIKNLDPRIPFLGTKSYETLKVWMTHLGITEEECVFVNASNKVGKVTLKDSNDNGILCALQDGATKIICLGKYAENVYTRLVNQNELEWYADRYFVLPHPSLRNRQLNNKAYVRMRLRSCKEFLTKLV